MHNNKRGVDMRNLFLAVAVVGVSMAAPAWAACTAITKAPYTISESGQYCLAKNVATSKNAISITADEVTLDCDGYTIDGSGQAASTTKRGISGYSRTGVIVRNCTVKGFIEGIRLTGTRNTVADNVVIAPYSRGIVVEGEENIVERNRIDDAGGTSNTSWGAYGIIAKGPAIVRGNVVSGVVPTAGSRKSGYGIYSSNNDAGVLEGNVVRNVVGDGGAIAMALTAHESSNAVFKQNILVNPPETYAYALYCSGDGSLAVENVYQGFTSGVSEACGVSGNVDGDE
jgi:hypothetical protein